MRRILALFVTLVAFLVLAATASATVPNPLCSPSPCTKGVQRVYDVTADDGAGSLVTRGYYVCRPANLVNDATHPVVLVIGFQNDQNWAGENGYPGCTGPEWDCATLLCTYVQMDPTHGYPAQYADPTVAGTAGAHTCGPSGTGQCDDIPEYQAILAAVDCSGALPCQNPARIIVTGVSKGSTMAEDVMCDTRTSGPQWRGYFGISDTLVSANSSTAPLCPALLGPTPNTNLSVMWGYGTADSTFTSSSCSSNCLAWGYTNTGGKWQWGTYQLATYELGAHIGCPSTPESTSTLGSTGKWTETVYGPCSHNGAATAVLAGSGAGHLPEGYDGLNLADTATNFFNAHHG